MSFGFDLNAKPSESILAGGNVEQIDEYSPGVWDGVGEGISSGFMKGGANVGRFIGMAGAVAPIAYDALAGDTKAQDWYFDKVVEDTLTDSVDYWTPDAKRVGKAGQVLGGLSAIALPLMVGGGNPSVLIGESYANPAIDLVNKGVDSTTASGVGALNAAATGIGFYLPFFGKTLTTKMLSGSFGNLGVNMAATAAQQQTLEAGNYEEIAKSYNPLDLEARALDVLMGAAFGGIAHLKSPRVLPSERDAILTATNARNFQHDSAPGRPLDMPSSVAHQDALAEALNQISRGETVDIASMVENSAFIPRNRGEDPTIPLPDGLRDEADIDSILTGADEMAPPQPAEPLTDISDPVPEAIVAPQADVASSATPAKSTPESNTQQAATPITREFTEATKILESNPDLVVTREDGTRVAVRELMDSMATENKQFESDSKAYEAAVNCFLGGA